MSIIIFGEYCGMYNPFGHCDCLDRDPQTENSKDRVWRDQAGRHTPSSGAIFTFKRSIISFLSRVRYLNLL